MNNSLEDLLREEPDEILFANMKHKSHCDFETRIISGRILFERQEFDRFKMSTEKKIMVDKMKERLKYFNNPVKSARRLRHKAMQPALWGVLFSMLFVISELLDCDRNSKGFDWVGLSIILLTVVAILVFEIATLSNQIQKNAENERDEKELLINRLDRIDKEWPF